MKALIVVDVQNDFCEGGSLAVTGGLRVAAAATRLVESNEPTPFVPSAGEYHALVATRDWHIDPGSHFSAAPDFVDSWPRHCVVGTSGASFAGGLSEPLFDAVFDKGRYTAAYSGFEGRYEENGPLLGDWLKAHKITQVDVCGLATDFCVRATALDAAKAGFQVTVLSDLCAAVHPDNVETVYTELREAGITIV